jgi:FkbM family methyltransferase
LQSLSKTNQLIFNQGAWNKDTTLDLRQAKDPGLSSCKRPNPEFLKSFDTSTVAGFQTVKNIPIKVNTLDSMIPQDYQQIIDFIKIDIEGGSWEALNGTTDLLSNNIIHALNLECEYNPKWKDQYLFGEVDTFLRKYHYQLYNAKNLQGKRTAGLRSGTSRTGQLVHGDFFIFDTDIFIEKIVPLNEDDRLNRIFKYIITLCLFEAFDVAYEILNRCKKDSLLDEGVIHSIAESLKPPKSYLTRFDNLGHRGSLLKQFIYHIGMAIIGIWLKKSHFWQLTAHISE